MLVFGGRLPLELGAAFEQAIWNIASRTWRPSTSRSGLHPRVRRRSRPRTLLVGHSPGAGVQAAHHSAAPPRCSCMSAGEATSDDSTRAIQMVERLVCDARRLTIKPSEPRVSRTYVSGRLRLLRAAARSTSARRALAVPRLHRRARTRRAPRSSQSRVAEGRSSTIVILLCRRNHTLDPRGAPHPHRR